MSGADRGSMRDQIEAARRELEDAMNAALRKPHDGRWTTSAKDRRPRRTTRRPSRPEAGRPSPADPRSSR